MLEVVTNNITTLSNTDHSSWSQDDIDKLDKYDKAIVFKNSDGEVLARVKFNTFLEDIVDNKRVYKFSINGSATLKGLVEIDGEVNTFSIYGYADGATGIEDCLSILGTVSLQNGTGDIKFNNTYWNEDNMVTITNIFISIE